jgi:CheY-like chemotaxis protein
VITDMTMPKMTGLELVPEDYWRFDPDIPIILCTGYSEIITEERRKGSLGIKRLLFKPLESTKTVNNNPEHFWIEAQAIGSPPSGYANQNPGFLPIEAVITSVPAMVRPAAPGWKI